MAISRGATITTKAVGSGTSTNFNITGHTTDAGTDCLLVGVFWSGITTTTVSTITWGGVSLTLVPSSTATQSGVSKVEWYYLLAPTIQTGTVTVTMSAGARGGAVAINYSGVHQTVPVGTAATNTNGVANTGPTVTVTSATGEVVIAGWCTNNGDTTTETTDASVSEICNFIGSAGAASNSGREVAGDKAGAASVVMSGTWSATRLWAASGFPLKPAAATTSWGPSLSDQLNRLVLA